MHSSADNSGCLRPDTLYLGPATVRAMAHPLAAPDELDTRLDTAADSAALAAIAVTEEDTVATVEGMVATVEDMGTEMDMAGVDLAAVGWVGAVASGVLDCHYWEDWQAVSY